MARTLAVAALLGCGAARPRVAPAAGSLVFVCEPADARVTIDETDLGPCALWSTRGVALPAGTHRLVVSREGYLPMESEVVPDGRRVTVRAVLRRVPE
ncbi:MAG: PEGA domain-containing protein [Deltaproteobacteria bacterium]|nr:PEGA domain-containing protein [Deltaproteobacteria bacterium]